MTKVATRIWENDENPPRSKDGVGLMVDLDLYDDEEKKINILEELFNSAVDHLFPGEYAVTINEWPLK